MIYATAMEIDKYDVLMPDGMYYGINATYGHTPEFLALLLIGTPVGYEYEGGMDDGEKTVELRDSSCIEDSLDVELETVTIREHLVMRNPMEFYDLIRRTPNYILESLPIVKGVYGGDPTLFVMMVSARSAAWALNFRGKLKSKGNVTIVAFGGGGIPVSEEAKIANKILSERFGK